MSSSWSGYCQCEVIEKLCRDASHVLGRGSYVGQSRSAGKVYIHCSRSEMKLRRIPMPITRRVMKTMAPNYLIQGNGTVYTIDSCYKNGDPQFRTLSLHSPSTPVSPKFIRTLGTLPMGDEAAQALELMERMIKLKEHGLQGEQITRHFTKSQLAPIKERSRTAFEFDGKHDPNREDPDSLDFMVMKERMYKIFSNAIVVCYSHLLPEFALMKSDPPITQRRSPRCQTGQGSGGPKIQSETQPNTSNPAVQSDSRKRMLVLSDDEGDDAGKPGDKGATGKLPKQANPKKKTSSRPMPKIRKSSRKPSDKDPFGKDSDPTNMETGSSKETGPTAKDHPSDNQPATDNVEPSNEPPTGSQSAEAGAEVNQEPPTRNQSDTGPSQEIAEVEAQAGSPPRKDAINDLGSRSPVKAQESTRPRPEIITGPMIGDEEEILRIRAAKDSRPPIPVKWWDNDMQPQGIVINKQKEDEEVCLLKKALSQATRIVNRIHLRNEAKTATIEKLVPHLGTLEATRNQLHKAKELARKTEHDLRDRIAELQESNFELSGSSKDHKIKSQAQFNVFVGKIKRLEGARDEDANAATPLVQAMFFNNNGPKYQRGWEYGSSLALAMTKSLYPKIDIDAVDGFADGTSEEASLDLINDTQKAADKIAVDVVERFQDTDLRPTGPDNSDDQKTDTD
uniref:Retrotransposon protein, putative, unclassified n=3 Tax=Oryza sativa subsp. japonica TaxID=39947 RepID=Q53J52_ORYSJ|nr:retrotransposon protein, putative, unclassified [Oryza sativa Japonica Group]ABA93028.1 retrotransposon protein, putative, unclassified [Oryza sativa Japonica Group]